MVGEATWESTRAGQEREREGELWAGASIVVSEGRNSEVG